MLTGLVWEQNTQEGNLTSAKLPLQPDGGWTGKDWSGLLREKDAAEATWFHQSLPYYAPTPLHELQNQAKDLQVDKIFIKDESTRFGLDSFKVLGVSYAVALALAKYKRLDTTGLTFSSLCAALWADPQKVTFFAATDGNHGKGLAWIARQLHQNAKIFMPAGSSPRRMEAIRREGASAHITDLNYDECVQKTARLAAETPDAVFVQDTAWEGYTEIPTGIMLGYGTLIREALEQMKNEYSCEPSHVFVQAGVGSLAGAIQSYLLGRFPENPPKVIVVESSSADCFLRSQKNGVYTPVNLSLEPPTVMAGLSCGESSLIGRSILERHAAAFVSIPDRITAAGMRILAAPLRGDPAIVSGESGAAGFAAMWEILSNPECHPLKDALGINTESRILCISTEGATDPDRYRQIVWGGELPYENPL